jgi:hypothetical protein
MNTETDNPNRRRSNIARLPYEVREMINQAIFEGEEYKIISARVEHLLGKWHGVYPSNLSSWFKTGYRDWLREKNRLQDTIAQSDAALAQLCRLKKETGAALPDLLTAFLASILQKTLQNFDPAALNSLLAEKPAEVFRLIACLNHHIAATSQDKKAEVARVRCQVEMAEKARAARQEPVPAHNQWEAALVDKAFGTPFEQLMHSLDKHKPAADAIPEKGRSASHNSQPQQPA